MDPMLVFVLDLGAKLKIAEAQAVQRDEYIKSLEKALEELRAKYESPIEKKE